MRKNKGSKTSAVKPVTVETVLPVETVKAVETVISKTAAELNAIIATSDQAIKDQLLAKSRIPANVQDNTKGQYRALAGGITTDRELAKKDKDGKPIPVSTHGLGKVEVNGVTIPVVHFKESEQLARKYASDAYGTIAAYQAKRNAVGRTLSDTEISTILRSAPDAWRPRFKKDGSPQAQYARHIAVFRAELAKRNIQ